MSYISPLGVITPQTNYNAVKIKINKPETNVSDNYCGKCQDNAAYNAINIEVNRPKVNMGTPVCNKCEHNKPVSYSANYYLYQSNPIKEPEQTKPVSEEITDNSAEVPEPNFTTTENEKLNNKLSFHGKDVEIVPSKEIQPNVDINDIVANLKNKDFDKQATQMEDIAKTILSKKGNAEDFVVNDVFTSLIDIAQKDTTGLEAPSKEQIETRKKIIANIIATEKNAKDANDKDNKLPFDLSKEEIAKAMELSPLEQAERNKEYAISTLALLSKTYIDGYEKRTGKVVPITDVPGIANIVDTIKISKNPDVKAASIDALMFIYRKEYSEEIKEILSVVAKNEDTIIAKRAEAALNAIKE